MSSRRGNSALEAALFVPFLVTLLVAMQQIGKVTYTYFTVKKVAYSAARYIATQQGVNVCDSADPSIVAGLNFGLTGTTDGSGAPIVTGLTADMFLVGSQSYDQASGTASTYDCSLSGVVAPDLIVVSIPGGYQMTPIIPFLTQTTIPLTVQVKVPYGGT
jgi:Flp pilus assembly protein TadG